MIALSADREDRRADVAQRDRPAVDLETAFGEVVFRNSWRRYSECMRYGMRVASAFQAIRSIIGVRSPMR